LCYDESWCKLLVPQEEEEMGKKLLIWKK
jgi:hypothetical protein